MIALRWAAFVMTLVCLAVTSVQGFHNGVALLGLTILAGWAMTFPGFRDAAAIMLGARSWGDDESGEQEPSGLARSARVARPRDRDVPIAGLGDEDPDRRTGAYRVDSGVWFELVRAAFDDDAYMARLAGSAVHEHVPTAGQITERGQRLDAPVRVGVPSGMTPIERGRHARRHESDDCRDQGSREARPDVVHPAKPTDAPPAR